MPIATRSATGTRTAPSFKAAGSLLIVGSSGEVHVGRHFDEAARGAAVAATLVDTHDAYAAPAPIRIFNWRFRGRRPTRLDAFSRGVLETCRAARPSSLLTTGMAPVDARTLREIRRMGIRVLSFLTDDPWSPAQRAPWFMDALGEYDDVFSPRQANLEQLRALGGPSVSYLPFGYSPAVHFPEPPAPAEADRFSADLVFVGGADPERVAWLEPVIAAGYRVALYGGYWDRYPATRAAARGMADAATVRKAVGGASVALCLVRRSNRDGHSMRTFEAPAIGACLIVEDTIEHRTIFGEPGRAVAYARSPDRACHALARLLADKPDRARLRHAAHRLIVDGRNTYRDRLNTMLEAANNGR